MAFCTNCGKEIPENAAFCTECGAQLNKNEDASAQESVAAAAQPQPQPQPQPQSQPAPQASQANPNDKGGIGWGLLGCCIPIVGLILFLVWKGEKPKTAKAAGIGAIVGVALTLLWYIIAAVVGVGAAVIGA